MAEQYINNKQFLQLIVDYKKKLETNPEARVPNSIGEMLMLMTNRIATRHNFNAYTYKDEMIGDGILKALIAVPKFDPERSDNPFAYFTRIIFNAFIQRIQSEKKQRALKNQLIMVDDIFSTQPHDDKVVTKDQIIGDFEFNSVD